jgi:hypothetical protein
VLLWIGIWNTIGAICSQVAEKRHISSATRGGNLRAALPLVFLSNLEAEIFSTLLMKCGAHPF